jgi:hypothetical protein
MAKAAAKPKAGEQSQRSHPAEPAGNRATAEDLKRYYHDMLLIRRF